MLAGRAARLRSCRTATGVCPGPAPRRAASAGRGRPGGWWARRAAGARVPGPGAGDLDPLPLAARERGPGPTGQVVRLRADHRTVDRPLVGIGAPQAAVRDAAQRHDLTDGERDGARRLLLEQGDPARTRLAREAGARATSWTSTAPFSGGSRPATRRSSVVLPAPFGPSSPVRCPDGGVASIPSTTQRPPSRVPTPSRVRSMPTPSRGAAGTRRPGRR